MPRVRAPSERAGKRAHKARGSIRWALLFPLPNGAPATVKIWPTMSDESSEAGSRPFYRLAVLHCYHSLKRGTTCSLCTRIVDHSVEWLIHRHFEPNIYIKFSE
eukprot:6205552-Pleurochrysis_carterae.AAC.2